jgi:hypothetical protein
MLCSLFLFLDFWEDTTTNHQNKKKENAKKDIVNMLRVSPDSRRDASKISRIKIIHNEDNGMAKHKNNLTINSYLNTGMFFYLFI